MTTPVIDLQGLLVTSCHAAGRGCDHLSVGLQLFYLKNMPGKRLHAPRLWPKGVDPLDDADDTALLLAKACTQCGRTKPLDEFYKRKAMRDGRKSECIACERIRGAAYTAANAERVRERHAAWRSANREEIRQRRAARYAIDPEPHRAASAAWAAANRERKRAADAARYKANRDEYRRRATARNAANPERRAMWRAKNADRVRAVQLAWYAATRVQRRMVEHAWKLANPELVRDAAVRRRARMRGAPVVERISRAAVWARDGGKCHICKRKCDPNHWHLEHIVPLADGGEHSMRNVAVSHPACNLRKGVLGPGQQRLFGDA